MTPLDLDPNKNYMATPVEPVDIPEWHKGLASFVKETGALGSGLKALGAQVVGAEEARDAALADYQQGMEEASSGMLTPAVGRIEDIKLTEAGGVGRFGDYLGYQVPKGIAQLGSLIVGGLGTGAVAKGLASKGIKELAKREIKDVALDAAKKKVVTPLAERAAGREMIAKLAKRQALGTTAGIVAGGSGMEAGHTYGKFANDPEIGPDKALMPALAYAGVAGVLEWMPIAAGAKWIGLDRTLLRKVIKSDPELAAKAVDLSLKRKALKTVGKVSGTAVAGALTEGITEGMQNLAQLAAERYAKEDPRWASILPRTPEEWSGFWNEAAAGAATGFFAGAALGPFRGQVQKPAPEEEDAHVAGQPPPPPPVEPPPPPPPVEPPKPEAPQAAPEAVQAAFDKAIANGFGPVQRDGGWGFIGPDGQRESGLKETKEEAIAAFKNEWQPTQEFVDGYLNEATAKTDTTGAKAPPAAAPQADQGAQPKAAQPGEVAVQEPTIITTRQAADGTWDVVDADGTLINVGMTEQEAADTRDQEIGYRAERGQVVSTTNTPQPQAVPQEPIAPEGAQPIGGSDALPVQQDPAVSPEIPGAARAATTEVASATRDVEAEAGARAAPAQEATKSQIETPIKVADWWDTASFSEKLNLVPKGITKTYEDFSKLSPKEQQLIKSALGEQIEQKKAEHIAEAKSASLIGASSAPALKDRWEKLNKEFRDTPVGETSQITRSLKGKRLEDTNPELADDVDAIWDAVKSADTLIAATLKAQVLAAQRKLQPGPELAASIKYRYAENLGKRIMDAIDAGTEEGSRYRQLYAERTRMAEETGFRNYMDIRAERDAVRELYQEAIGDTQEVRIPKQAAKQTPKPRSVVTERVPVETIRKADGTAFKSAKAASAELNRRWNKGLLKIEKGKEKGKIASARVVPEGDGFVIEKLENRDDEDAVGNRGTFEQDNPDILESRTQQPATSSIDFVAATDKLLGQGWTQRALDAGILQIKNTSSDGAGSGSYDKQSGILTINLDRLPKGKTPVGVLLHENSHASLEQMLGGQFEQFHKDLRKLAAQKSSTANEAMTRAVVGLGTTYKALIPNELDSKKLSQAEHGQELERVRGELEKQFPDLLRQEELAYYIQMAAEGDLVESGYWNRLKAALQAWFAQTDFGKAMASIGWRPELSPELAVELAKEASRQTVQRAELVNQILGERANLLRNLPAGSRGAVLEAQAQLNSKPGDVLESRDDSDLWWRSRVQEAVADARQQKAQPQQWLGWLKNQPGVKQEELDDLGLEDWLDAQEGVVTKQAVEQFVEDGGVRIEEKVLADKVDGEFFDGDDFDEAPYGEHPTEFSSYTFPGGENHRELLIAIPLKYTEITQDVNNPQVFEKVRENVAMDLHGVGYYDLDAEEQEAVSKILASGKVPQSTYLSEHYGEPNIIVHIRFSERTDTLGDRVLHVEEVQSDLHEEGRQRGYKHEATLDSEAKAEQKEQLDKWLAESEITQEDYDEAVANLDDSFTIGSVPDAPFKSSWPLLGMKRAIRWAAANGFDKVAWPRGAEALQYPGGWGGPPTQQDGEWIAPNGKNVTGIVNLYNKGLPQHLLKYGKKFGARVGTTTILDADQEVWSLPLTPKLRDEALAGQLLYSMPPMREWPALYTWLTSSVSTIPEDYNVPGVFNKVKHGMVDRFDYVKGKSQKLYRAFDEWKNRQGALQQEVQRMFLDPMQKLVGDYRPTGSDFEPIETMQIANGTAPIALQIKELDKKLAAGTITQTEYDDAQKLLAVGNTRLSHRPSAVEVVGHQLAARHIIEDDVTRQLALKAAPKFLEELKKELTPHNTKLLNEAIKQGTGGSTSISNLTKHQARALFESYLPSLSQDNAAKADLSKRWTLMNRRSAGYSIAQPGSIEAQEDAMQGFINAHDLYTKTVRDRKSFQRIAELSDQLAAHQLKLLQEGELLNQVGVDRLSKAYSHYVPLRREAFDYDRELAEMFEKPVANVGKLMTREGSTELASAVHVLQNHLASGFTAASAAARNQMMNKFADVLYKDVDGWKPWFYIKPERVHKNDIGFIKNGKELYIVPAEGNLRAASIVKVIAGKDAQELSGPLRVMRTINSWIRWSNVSASPAFMLANTPRDYLTAVYNLQATEAAEYAKEIASWTNYKESFRALRKVMVEGVRSSSDPQEQAWIDLVKDFEKAGGKTSFVEALRAMDGDSWKSFEARVGRRQGKLGNVVEFGREQLTRIENFNIVLENVMRLSTYKVMRNKVDKERAAEIARNLTTNFTRRGAHIDAMNTWWLFYNATVQGNYQVIQNLFMNPNKKGQKRLRKAVVNTIIFAFLIDQLGRALSDDDDDDGVSNWDARPAYEKDRKISAPFDIGGVYPSLPSPWVYNVFWRLGGMLGELKDGVLKPQDMVLDILGLITTTMNPISGGTAAQTVAPSSFDPFMQIIENKNFVGNPLGPDGYPGASKRPDAYLAWDSTPGIYKHVAEFVNEVTGGSLVESGQADFRPSSYKVLTDFALGSLGRTILDLGKLGLSPVMEGMDFEGPEKVPGLKVFLSAPSDSTAISLYHDRVAKVLGAKRLIKMYSAGAERNPEKLAEVQRERAAVLRLAPQVEDTERQIKSLRKTLRSAQARKDSRTEEMLRDRIVQLQKRFNQSYSRRVGN